MSYRIILALFVLTVATTVSAQPISELVKSIHSLEEAELFAEKYEPIHVYFFHDGSIMRDFDQRKDTLKIGDQWDSNYLGYRVVGQGEKELYNFQYIFFDGNKMDYSEIQKQRKEIIERYQNGDDFQKMIEEYSMEGPQGGNLGWVDPDLFVPSFRDNVKSHSKGEVFISDSEEQKWYHVVVMLDAPKKVNGWHMLAYPLNAVLNEPEMIDHEVNLEQISSWVEFHDYSKKYDDVNLHLFNEVNDLQFFWNIEGKNIGDIVTIENMRFKIIKDTSVNLYSFQYIYLNGDEMSKNEREEKLREIYTRYNKGESLDVLVRDYAPNQKEYSIMENVEGALLAPEVLEKLKVTPVGNLFVARVSQSYFVGTLLEPVQKAKAFLVIGYPVFEK